MTSGNDNEAPGVTAVAPHNGESKPPQAIVKPQVLTHVIEGFVIQEGAEPFPVCVSGTHFGGSLSRVDVVFSPAWREAVGSADTKTLLLYAS